MESKGREYGEGGRESVAKGGNIEGGNEKEGRARQEEEKKGEGIEGKEGGTEVT